MPHRGGRVAYAVTGDGPPLLMDVGRAHDLEGFWRHPAYRQLVRRLARGFTVVRWDRPGFGLSDRGTAALSPAAELALVERLVALTGAGEVAVLAAGDAAPGMVRFAATHPRVVSRLALFGTAAEGRHLALSLPDAALEALASARAPAIHRAVAAAAAAGCEPGVASWLAAALEASADAGVIAELIARTRQLDVRAAARRVQAPTLVLHREADTMVQPRWGRALAACIPGARFVTVPGCAHLVYAGDTRPVLEALLPFLAGAGAQEPVRERTPLSMREREVAHMVTLGLTNAEIGRRLAIRRRTVDAHLEHIRAKLGVRSRSRIAAWAVHDPAVHSSAIRNG